MYEGCGDSSFAGFLNWLPAPVDNKYPQTSILNKAMPRGMPEKLVIIIRIENHKSEEEIRTLDWERNWEIGLHRFASLSLSRKNRCR